MERNASFDLFSLSWFCHRQGPGGEVKDPAAARKVQKADRERLRRDRMNEHFFELGNILGTESHIILSTFSSYLLAFPCLELFNDTPVFASFFIELW